MLPSLRALVHGADHPCGLALAAELGARGAVVAVLLPASLAGSAEWAERWRAAGARVCAGEGDAAGLATALREVRPSHLFLLSRPTSPSAPIEACQAAGERPRIVLLSALGAGPRTLRGPRREAWTAEQALRASDLPYTIARAGRLSGGSPRPDPGLEPPRIGLANRLIALWAGAARALGASRHAARHRPTDAAELAYGLVHAALNYTTIGRVVMAEELRYRLANDREYHLPRSRRDGPRH